jgi:outer membrane protein assembly factor BamD
LRYFLFAFLILLGSCATQRPTGQTEAEVLFREAELLVKEGRYLMASEKINAIRSQYPYSYFATHAELLQADILFKQENYIEAAAAYILFKDFHPRNPKMDYVTYMIAESFEKQMPSTFDRDLSPGYEAIRYYVDLQRNFASSEYATSAVQKVERINKMLEQKEQYVADFYFKTKVYDAAIFRYKEILKNFTTRPLVDHAMLRIVEASYLLKQKSECLNYYQTFKINISNNYSADLDRAKSRCEGLKEEDA